MKGLLSFVAVTLMIGLSGCQLADEASTSPTGKVNAVALMEASDGKLYDANCIKESGLENMSRCEYRGVTSTPSGARGFNWSYFYYVLSPINYQQNNFCSTWFGYSNCWNYFGYNNSNYDFYYQPTCGSACYKASNPEKCKKKCWRNHWYY